jgi:hypothetical protein
MEETNENRLAIWFGAAQVIWDRERKANKASK